MSRSVHVERHRTERIGWLRAAVLGANDGIVSTASLIVGVAAASAARSEILVAGVAGLVAGAMSMAAGEFVSVSSQSDTVSARPVQAGLTSAATFAVGAALPLLTALVAPAQHVVPVVAGTSLVFLTALGALSARTGGAPVLKASWRVAFWGALAMGLTAAVGRLFGAVV